MIFLLCAVPQLYFTWSSNERLPYIFMPCKRGTIAVAVAVGFTWCLLTIFCLAIEFIGQGRREMHMPAIMGSHMIDYFCLDRSAAIYMSTLHFSI